MKIVNMFCGAGEENSDAPHEHGINWANTESRFSCGGKFQPWAQQRVSFYFDRKLNEIHNNLDCWLRSSDRGLPCYLFGLTAAVSTRQGHLCDVAFKVATGLVLRRILTSVGLSAPNVSYLDVIRGWRPETTLREFSTKKYLFMWMTIIHADKLIIKVH